MEYLDREFKESNIRVRYSQAVTSFGTDNDTIRFKQLNPSRAICIYHKGSYESLGDAYAFILKYIAENKLKITDCPRERYIDGVWTKENVEDWFAEIQVPV